MTRRRPSAAQMLCPLCGSRTSISSSRVLHGIKTRYRNCMSCEGKLKTKQRMTPQLGTENVVPLCDKIANAEARGKITAEDVREIRAMLEKQYAQQYIADRFDISRYMVGAIRRGDAWSYVT